MKKALILLALFSSPAMAAEGYCGQDVPYNVVIVDDALLIQRMNSSEECKFDGHVAACPTRAVINIEKTDTGIVLDWPGLKMPIVMPKCDIVVSVK